MGGIEKSGPVTVYKLRRVSIINGSKVKKKPCVVEFSEVEHEMWHG